MYEDWVYGGKENVPTWDTFDKNDILIKEVVLELRINVNNDIKDTCSFTMCKSDWY